MAYRKISADMLFTGYTLLPPGQALILNDNTIEAIIPVEAAGEDLQYFPGILCPGFINSHCHLELSHLKNVIPAGTGLIPFIETILKNRDAPPGKIREAMAAGQEEMWANGIVAVGDICNTTDSLSVKSKGKILYRNFIELLGFIPGTADRIYESGREVLAAFRDNEKLSGPAGLVPHAPYTVSRPLFEKINHDQVAGIISIHNQESEEENYFFRGKKNLFTGLYESLEIDISFFRPTGKTSLQTYFSWLSQPAGILLVHNTFMNAGDIDFLQAAIQQTHQSVFCCLCPNANLYIENQLPPVDLFLEKNLPLLLGTDSLASNTSLNIVDEINTIRKFFPQIPLEKILQWATSNGAKALGFDTFLGSFEKGKQPGVNVLTQADGSNLLQVQRIL